MEWWSDGIGERDQGHNHDYGEQGSPQFRGASLLNRDLLTGCYANGVKLQSPASRSTRWVTDHPYDRTPTGFHK